LFIADNNDIFVSNLYAGSPLFERLYCYMSNARHSSQMSSIHLVLTLVEAYMEMIIFIGLSRHVKVKHMGE